jgi:hypothetical protein
MRSRTIAAALVALLLTAGERGANGVPSTLLLKVTNLAQVSDEALGRAEREVARVYRDAGVDTIWTDSLAEPPAGDALAVDIVIVYDAPSAEPATGYRFEYDHLGYVTRPELRIHAFWLHIYETAIQFLEGAG